jgi:uncharacterized membrane protein
MHIPIHIPDHPAESVYLLLRWIHFLAGITWIGMLYFFNLVNVPFMKEVDAAMKPAIFKGMTLRTLWWFRWSAVFTVLAGLIYWMMMASAEAGIQGASVGKLHGTFFGIWLGIFVIEYVLIMVVKLDNGYVLGGIMTVLLLGGAWLFLAQNSGGWASNRTLSIGIGGGMGIIMLLNVWGIIWRAQKRIINGVLSGTPAIDAARLARAGYLASRTNFVMSVPMLLFMAIASHYPVFG